MHRRKRFSCGLVIIAMLLLWLSAHDLYVSRINQQHQALIQSLSQGSHDLNWSLKSTSDLVTGFGGGWVMQPKGLQLNTHHAEVSLAFKERFIVPEYYQQLRFDWIGQVAATENTRLQLEFSQVDSGVFYYSSPIKVKTGLNQINLKELKWTAKKDNKNTALNWQNLPLLNTLVWRFSQQDGPSDRAILRHVSIPQTKAIDSFEQTSPFTVLLSNQLRQQWQSQRLNLKSSPVMAAYLNITPWLLFGMGVLCLLLAVKIVQPSTDKRRNQIHLNGAYRVIAVVALVAAFMQTKPLYIALERWPWLAIVVFLLPTVLLVKRWLRPGMAAGPVWAFTLLIGFLMWYLSDLNGTFISDMPLYFLWAVAQQVILGPLVSDYLQQKAGLSRGLVALLCGVLFALLHVPNQMLMLATFFGGLLWSYAWLRYRNIYANAVSHALLALLFYQTMPEHLLGTARVGLWF